MVVPCITALAPITGSPVFASVTVPLMVPVWAKTIDVVEKQRANKILRSIIFCLRKGRFLILPHRKA
jgi:hypothetical protein